MKSMLVHSFVLDALDTTRADTCSHFEILIEKHCRMTNRLLEDIHHLLNSSIPISVSSSVSQPIPNRIVLSQLK